LLVADDPARFAAQTLRLLGSPSLRQALAQHGRQAVQRYDWSQSIARLEELLEVALGNAPKTRGPAWQPAHSR
jgi:glycosyltransferase involved in cell wall biosynthesis